MFRILFAIGRIECSLLGGVGTPHEPQVIQKPTTPSPTVKEQESVEQESGEHGPTVTESRPQTELGTTDKHEVTEQPHVDHQPMLAIEEHTKLSEQMPDLEELETLKAISHMLDKHMISEGESLPQTKVSLPQEEVSPPPLPLKSKAFEGIERELRSTFFKSGSSVQKLLDAATVKAGEQFRSAPDQDELRAHLKNTPPAQIKDEIARSIGALRSDKYGSEATYSQLSANKKALVDAIYKGMTTAPEGALTIPEGSRGEVQQPGVKSKLTRDVTIDGVAFKKGDPCILLEKDGKTYIQQMVKDSKGKVEVKDKLFPLADKTLVPDAPQKFVKIDRPLFVGPISNKDIHQGAIADCYLIAGIYDIATKNPDAIHKMIKDNGDGTVTVRLFEKDGRDLKPKYVTFEKSVPKGEGVLGTLGLVKGHAEDTAWVQMLEKAFAIHKGSYRALDDGGHSHEVFEAFLGIPSDHIKVEATSLKTSTMMDEISPCHMDDHARQQLKARQQELGLTDEQVKELSTASNDQLVDSKNTITGTWKWPQFSDENAAYRLLLKNKEPDKEKLKAAKEKADAEKEKLTQFVGELEKLTSTQDKKTALQSLLDQSPTYNAVKDRPAILRGDLNGILADLQRLAEKQPTITQGGRTFDTAALVKEFSGLGGNRKDLFERLKSALDEGQYVGIGTQENIGKSQGKGHSGGESIVAGLAGLHAYAVLDAVEMNGRQFVRIANPWGNEFARDYTMGEDGQLVAKKFDKKDYSYLPESESRAGAGIGINESWIEMGELSRLFDQYYVTKKL